MYLASSLATDASQRGTSAGILAGTCYRSVVVRFSKVLCVSPDLEGVYDADLLRNNEDHIGG
jgi:hypothetical protein